MTDTQHNDPFETRLIEYFQRPAPSAQFSESLAQKLRAEPQPGRSRPRDFRLGWAITTVAVLALLAGVLLVGPDRVLAVFRGLLGYVPGVGTVELDDTLVFPGPVSVTHDGITLTVEQVTAAGKTIVSVALTGLPADQPVFWERSRVRLPGGQEWFAARVPKSTTSDPANHFAAASFEYPALPPGTTALTFVWRQFGGPYQDELVRQWEILIQLRAASDPQLAPAYGAGYGLEPKSATNHGVSLQVLEIVTTSDRTLLHVRWSWPAEHYDWSVFPAADGAYLQDAAGNRYAALAEQGEPLDGNGIEMAACADGGECYNQGGYLAFEPVSADAAGLRLHLPAFGLAWNPGLSFDLDLGAQAAAGDSFKIDAALTLPAGGELPLTGARIELLADLPGAPIGLRVDTPGQPDSAIFQVETIWFQSGGGVNYPWAVTWEDGRIPTGVYRVQLTHAQGWLRGPWLVTVTPDSQP